jgi:hypothetical protein
VSTVLVQDGAVLKIGLTGDRAARLFGLPFLVTGGYLGYQLAGGIVDLLTGRAPVLEMLPGTLVLLVVALAFLTPAWLLLFSRANIEIDRAARSVTYVRDFRIHQLRETRALSEFARIEVDLLSVSPNRRSRGRRAYQVELASLHGQNVVIGVFDAGDDALAFGRRVGDVIGLPAEDLREVERDARD